MPIQLHRRHALLVGAIALLALVGAALPLSGAQAATQADWFGWGVHVDFAGGTWKVEYTTYIGRNLPQPHIVDETISDISADCAKRGTGTLSYPTPDSAYFDGSVYIECALPSLRSELLALGFAPPSGDQPFCPCTLGRGPLWVDGEVRQLTRSGSMPLLDVGERGLRVNLLVNGGSARTKLEVTRAQPPGGYITYTTPPWTIDTAGDRTLVGWDGDALVAVADHFGRLTYMTDQGWRPFFKTSVSGNRIGYWNESPTQSGTSALSGKYRVGMNGGTLYIGYSPSTGQYLTGEIDEAEADPGCSGA
jgi:hypothetical protein